MNEAGVENLTLYVAGVLFSAFLCLRGLTVITRINNFHTLNISSKDFLFKSVFWGLLCAFSKKQWSVFPCSQWNTSEVVRLIILGFIWEVILLFWGIWTHGNRSSRPCLTPFLWILIITWEIHLTYIVDGIDYLLCCSWGRNWRWLSTWWGQSTSSR